MTPIHRNKSSQELSMSEGPQEIHHAGHGNSVRSARGIRNHAGLRKRYLTGQAHSGKGWQEVGGWVVGRERGQKAKGIWDVLAGGWGGLFPWSEVKGGLSERKRGTKKFIWATGWCFYS
jgi:hypothetical protein